SPGAAGSRRIPTRASPRSRRGPARTASTPTGRAGSSPASSPPRRRRVPRARPPPRARRLPSRWRPCPKRSLARPAPRRRARRPSAATASAAVGEADLADLAERRFGEGGARGTLGAGTADPDAAVARAVGVAIHAVLEEHDLEAPAEVALARARERLPALVR